MQHTLVTKGSDDEVIAMTVAIDDEENSGVAKTGRRHAYLSCRLQRMRGSWSTPQTRS